MTTRIKQIYKKLESAHLDGVLLSDPANISYLTDFSSRDSHLLVTKKENTYITDARYTQEVRKNISRSFSLAQTEGSLNAFEVIPALCRKQGLKRIGFEAKHLSFRDHLRIKKQLKGNVLLVPVYGFVEELRLIKTEPELIKIKKATAIAISALRFIEKFIRPGIREIEVAGELERFIRYNGASSSSFDIIVASGCNSGYPHHHTSSRKLKRREPLLIDMGVDYFGYKSDLTRVFFSGKITPIFARVYDIVRQAQAKAIKEIKPDVKISDIDTTARQFITQKGYGSFFVHGLGHGVGLEIHEEPYISSRVNNKLKPGMVFTLEPAIYLPGKFGIRIEDMVLVTQKGVEVLSGALDK